MFSFLGGSTCFKGWYMSLIGDFGHHLHMGAQDCIPNSSVMLNLDIDQPLQLWPFTSYTYL